MSKYDYSKETNERLLELYLNASANDYLKKLEVIEEEILKRMSSFKSE